MVLCFPSLLCLHEKPILFGALSMSIEYNINSHLFSLILWLHIILWANLIFQSELKWTFAIDTLVLLNILYHFFVLNPAAINKSAVAVVEWSIKHAVIASIMLIFEILYSNKIQRLRRQRFICIAIYSLNFAKHQVLNSIPIMLRLHYFYIWSISKNQPIIKLWLKNNKNLVVLRWKVRNSCLQVNVN